MASVKFSAFENASEEFNSDLARLVESFTHSLVKLISQECARSNDQDDGTGSKKSSPFSSPKGKAPRKKAAPKRGRPSKDETDVVIDNVDDMRSVSDELSFRAETVRSSSNQPDVIKGDDNGPSIALNLDDMIKQQPEIIEETKEATETPTKKGKAAAKTPKEKAPAKEKKEKVPKEKKEKAPPKEKKEKVPKEKKEKAPPKEKKGKAPPKGKKDDNSEVVVDETIGLVDVVAEVVEDATKVADVVQDDDDNDGLDEELIASQGLDEESFTNLTDMMKSMKIGGQLDEETDFVDIVTKLEGVVSSSQNSHDDEIVISETTPKDTGDICGDDDDEGDDDQSEHSGEDEEEDEL